MITKPLKQYLIEIMSASMALEVTFLVSQVKGLTGRSYSIQAIYKELKNLQEEGVVVKAGNKYSLRLPWVLDFISLSDSLAKTYLDKPRLDVLLPEMNKKEIWHFSDLLKMNDFWSHLLLVLVQQSKTKALLGWNPHPWFHLVQTDKEEQYIKALKLARAKLYLLVGGNYFLDKWTEKFWPKDIVEHSFAKSDFQAERATYFNVVDDYVLTVKLDPKIAKTIDKIYETTKSINDLNIQEVLSVFHQKTKASIWLEYNPEKARKIKIKFKKFWGRDFK